MPLISVIIPAYNSEKYLGRCLKSVQEQTIRDIEIICVDDGSTDGTAAIIDSYAMADSRFIPVHQQNAGAGAARNAGLRLAKGRYLSFLDADDFYEPEMLEIAFAAAESCSAQVVVYGADFYDENLKLYHPCDYSLRTAMMPENRPFAAVEVEKDIFKMIVGWAWDKLFLREYILQKGLEFQEQRTTNDAFFVFCAIACAERITTDERIMVHHSRNTGESLSVTREKSWMCFYNALIKMRSYLQEQGIFERFEQDFVNYALHFSLWNLNTLKDPVRKTLYGKLRDEWFRSLGIEDKPANYFYHRGEYNQYLKIKAKPYPGRLDRAFGFVIRAMRHAKSFAQQRLHRAAKGRSKKA